jgi:protein-S-isoprenylcysteine O-methyltransferase Ste14
MTARLVEFRPPRIAMLLVLIAALAHWTLGTRSIPLFSDTLLATVLGGGGFTIMMWAWWLFRKAETAICPTELNDSLVTSGIYRLSRHPMYLGMILMLAGLATLVGTLPFYLAALTFYLVIETVFRPYEEAKLLDTFGADYTTYRERVRRWI